MSDIGSLAIRLSLDDGNFNRSMSQVNRNLKTLGGEMAIIRNKGKEWGNSLEGLSEKQNVLKNILSQQEAKVKDAAEKHRKLAEEHGEGSVKAEKQAAALNKLVAQFTKTESELKEVNDALNVHHRQMDEAQRGYIDFTKVANKLGSKLEETGEEFKNTGQKLTTGVSLPLTGFAVAAGKAALDFDKASGSIQAELGISEKKAKDLNATAKELWEDGFGDSIESVSVKVAGVTRALGDLSRVDLSYVTKGLDLFEQRGWADQQEALRATKILMEQFGMTASEAMDYLTRGFQENLNFSGEFLDSVSEYSTYFSEFGLTADDMFAKLKSGAENGVFQLDKIGDAMKEFSLRSKDGSKASTEAFTSLGLNAKKMTSQFNKGGEDAKKAFEKVIKALNDTEDETLKNEIAVGLFGTQFEDVGEKAFDAMLDASKGLDNVEGATKKASDALKDNFGARATKIWREFQSDLKPVGETLLDIAEDVLPKVADTVEDVTDAFEDLGPEGQKAALAVGGIAIAAGPTLTGLGLLSTGVGTLTKGVAPLLSSLGKGSGLTGILTKIPGPVGLVAGGLALATTAVISVKNATDEAKKVNLEHVESLIEQKNSLEGLSSKYNDLREKNKLSNDELLRFRDIQSELDIASSAEEIRKLKDEADGLRQKSGLSNEEMSKMLKLNDDIIKLTPDVEKAFSDRGEAIVKNKDALDDLNKSLNADITRELNNELDKLDSNLDKNISKHVNAINELKEADKERVAARIEADETEQKILDLKLEKEKLISDGRESAAQAIQTEIEIQERLLFTQNQSVSSLSDTVNKKEESVKNTQKEIDETLKLYDKLINIQLINAGINQEGAKGIAQLDQSIAKTQGKIQNLLLIKDAQGGLNSKQEEELKNLSKALGQYQNAKGEIVEMQGEQSEVNRRIDEGTGKAKKLTDEAGKDVRKEVDVDDKGGAAKLQRETEKGAHKKVNVNDHGDNRKIQRDAEKKADKGVRLSLLNTLSSLVPSSISVGVKLLGKLPGFAKGTRHAPEGMALVGEEGPELVHLPQGAKVIPNPQTEAVLRNWNIPMLASGGVSLSSGMALVGEKGPELMDMRGARTAPLPSSNSQQHTTTTKQSILIQMVTPDQRVLAEMVVDDVSKLQNQTKRQYQRSIKGRVR